MLSDGRDGAGHADPHVFERQVGDVIGECATVNAAAGDGDEYWQATSVTHMPVVTLHPPEQPFTSLHPLPHVPGRGGGDAAAVPGAPDGAGDVARPRFPGAGQQDRPRVAVRGQPDLRVLPARAQSGRQAHPRVLPAFGGGARAAGDYCGAGRPDAHRETGGERTAAAVSAGTVPRGRTAGEHHPPPAGAAARGAHSGAEAPAAEAVSAEGDAVAAHPADRSGGAVLWRYPRTSAEDHAQLGDCRTIRDVSTGGVSWWDALRQGPIEGGHCVEERLRGDCQRRRRRRQR
eukprot:ctg_1812.g695